MVVLRSGSGGRDGVESRRRRQGGRAGASGRRADPTPPAAAGFGPYDRRIDGAAPYRNRDRAARAALLRARRRVASEGRDRLEPRPPAGVHGVGLGRARAARAGRGATWLRSAQRSSAAATGCTGCLRPTSRSSSAAPACTARVGPGALEIGYWIRASRPGGARDRGGRRADARRVRALRRRARSRSGSTPRTSRASAIPQGSGTAGCDPRRRSRRARRERDAVVFSLLRRAAGLAGRRAPRSSVRSCRTPDRQMSCLEAAAAEPLRRAGRPDRGTR